MARGKMTSGTRRGASMFVRIFVPLLGVILLQTILYYFVIVHGNVVSTLNNSAADVVVGRVDNLRNDLESSLLSNWSNLEAYADSLNELYADHTQDGTALYEDQAKQRDFLADTDDLLVSILRGNEVNGAFVILANSKDYQGPTGDPQSYYGLCIRDYDLSSSYIGREDLLLDRSPSSLATELGIPLDSYWEALYTFDGSERSGDYFYKPLQQAYSNPGVDVADMGYLCGSHTYEAGDQPVISYSIPLVADDGTVYGVLGIELTETYLASLVPVNQLMDQAGSAFALVQYNEGSTDWQIVAYNGPLFNMVFGDVSDVNVGDAVVNQDDSTGRLLAYMGKQNIKVDLYVAPLTIYSRNTPFETETFALVGICRDDMLFSTSTEIRQQLALLSVCILGVGVGLVGAIGGLIVRPVKRLTNEVQVLQSDAKAAFNYTGIREVDHLVRVIEDQSLSISRNRARTDFFSRMSHDMRTPMNAIIGLSSPEILEGCDKDEMTRNLASINDSGKYLLGLINEILDMAKIESGKIELDQEPFDTESLWNTPVGIIQKTAAERGVRFIANLPQGQNHVVVGDMQRLNQIVINLLSNAVKFTPEGGSVVMSVTETPGAGKTMAYKIVVHDEGIGMSKEYLERMYQPFSQENTNQGGTGLGLSIAHQLVTLMNGTISCESALGKGTTFTIELSLPLAEASVVPERQSPVLHDDGYLAPLEGKRVLLCEDHPLNRQIARRLLEKAGMVIDVAENGRIGLDIFAASAPGTFDVVLMDIRMPEMDGIQATCAIRALDREDAAAVPIIAMTANAFQEDRDATKAAGMNAHLAKPIEPDKLYATLLEYLAG